MEDFREMYLILFRAVTQAIEILQDAQEKAEEIYISSEDDDNLIQLFPDDSAE